MRFVIEIDPESRPADWFPDEVAALDAARRVQQHAGTAIGP